MSLEKTTLLRQLIPKSYHFDAYNEVNCPNSRDKPFFADNSIELGKYHLSITFSNRNSIILSFESVCPFGKVQFLPFELNFDEYIDKLKEAIQSGRDFITFEIVPKYDSNSNFNCSECEWNTKDCMALLKRHINPNYYAAVSFDMDEVREALALYFEITTKSNSKGVPITMKNKKNFLGMNFKWGICKDPNIASTLTGVAVKNASNGNWYVFDPVKCTRTNLAQFKMGNFPIMLIPSKVAPIGSMIEVTGRYCRVVAANPDNTLKLEDIATGTVFDYRPEESIIPGMSFFTQVVAFDPSSLNNAFSKENVGGNMMAAMLMMQWSKGDKEEFSLDDVSDDSFNGLGSYLPLLMAQGNLSSSNILSGADGNINLPMLMMLGSSGSDSDDMTQMLVLSQLLSGSTTSCMGGLIPQVPIVGTVPSESQTEAGVRCEKCGKSYPTGTNFCPVCGEKTKEIANICHKCGAKLFPNAAFCHKCGSKVGINTCSKCGAELTAEENFCHVCGFNLKEEPKSVDASTKEEIAKQEE